MRNTYKTVIRITKNVTVFNMDKDAKEVVQVVHAEGTQPILPDNCVELKSEEVSRKEVKLKLTPELFMKYAVEVHDEDEE